MRFLYEKLLPAALDQPGMFPSREDARNRVQSGAGHFGDVLLGDRKVYPDTRCLLEAGLAGEP